MDTARLMQMLRQIRSANLIPGRRHRAADTDVTGGAYESESCESSAYLEKTGAVTMSTTGRDTTQT
jgi:hypothetical protein